MKAKYKFAIMGVFSFLILSLAVSLSSAYSYYNDYGYGDYGDSFSSSFQKPYYSSYSYSKPKYNYPTNYIVKPAYTKYYKIDYYNVYKPRVVYDYVYTKKQVSPVYTSYPKYKNYYPRYQSSYRSQYDYGDW